MNIEHNPSLPPTPPDTPPGRRPPSPPRACTPEPHNPQPTPPNSPVVMQVDVYRTPERQRYFCLENRGDITPQPGPSRPDTSVPPPLRRRAKKRRSDWEYLTDVDGTPDVKRQLFDGAKSKKDFDKRHDSMDSDSFYFDCQELVFLDSDSDIDVL